jgi:hypothetical protein
MNYGELKTAILSDSHREDYSTEVARFVQQAEGKIASQLDGYILTVSLTDANRTLDGLYSLIGSKVSTARRVTYLKRPLTQADESLAAEYLTHTDVLFYTMRGKSILFAGVPPALASIQLEFYGMPAALVSDTDTNDLLTEYPQLYLEAAQIFLYRRARNWDAVDRMDRSVNDLIRSINRRVRKQVGGAQSATPYNVRFRSSY